MVQKQLEAVDDRYAPKTSSIDLQLAVLSQGDQSPLAARNL
jgi:hypothetical protein